MIDNEKNQEERKIKKLEDEIREAMWQLKEGNIPKGFAVETINRCNREIEKIKGEDKQ